MIKTGCRSTTTGALDIKRPRWFVGSWDTPPTKSRFIMEGSSGEPSPPSGCTVLAAMAERWSYWRVFTTSAARMNVVLIAILASRAAKASVEAKIIGYIYHDKHF